MIDICEGEFRIAPRGIITVQRIFLNAAVVALAFAAAPIFADDFYEQFLVAACPSANPARSRVVVTAKGPGVRHKDGSIEDVVIYCQIHADFSNYFNWLQLIAEDNTPDGYAQATLWRTSIVSPRAPEALFSTTTSDKPGVQIAFNDQLNETLDVSYYVYWIEVRLVRTTTTASVIAYTTGLLDVF